MTALYDNFRTKEEIIVSLFEDVTQPVQDLIEWGRDQPHTLDAKQEFVRRYGVALAGAEPLFRFMQSQAAVRELRIGDTSKDRMRDLRGIFIDREAPPRRPGPLCQRQVTLHAGMFVMQELEGNSQKKREAVLQVTGPGHPGTPRHPDELRDTPRSRETDTENGSRNVTGATFTGVRDCGVSRDGSVGPLPVTTCPSTPPFS
ncbi:TetR/AcrR family transcriptional regulator [Streptomyces sp. 21So2-11]|uniref:TetR/AcrR family transcriptional regulator n=1 Tax=Streptomyces sp. 21So2-11 TaxID=3144408 RepID=UPI00321C0039